MDEHLSHPRPTQSDLPKSEHYYEDGTGPYPQDRTDLNGHIACESKIFALYLNSATPWFTAPRLVVGTLPKESAAKSTGDSRRRSCGRRQDFVLFELLVAIAIVSVVAAISLPLIVRAIR